MLESLVQMEYVDIRSQVESTAPMKRLSEPTHQRVKYAALAVSLAVMVAIGAFVLVSTRERARVVTRGRPLETHSEVPPIDTNPSAATKTATFAKG